MQPANIIKKRKIGFIRPRFRKRKKKSKENHNMDLEENNIGIKTIKRLIHDENFIIFELGCGEHIGIADREFIELGAEPRKRSRILKEAKILINCDEESIISSLSSLNSNRNTTNK